MNDDPPNASTNEPGSENGRNFKVLPEAQAHLTSLLKNLENGIHVSGKQAADKDSKTTPIIVTPEHLEDGFYFLVKNPPRIEYYRCWHTLMILTASVGTGFISAAIFQSGLSTTVKWLTAGVGILILVISILVDALQIDRPQKD